MACIARAIPGKPGNALRPFTSIDATGRPPSATRVLVPVARSPDAAPAEPILMDSPLLRAPPFPGMDASVTRSGADTLAALSPEAIDRVFTAIRDAQVGGCFWAS